MSENTPGQLTPDQATAAAAEQVQGIGADLGPGPQASPETLGAQMSQAGAIPAEIDANALLRQIQAMQSRLDVLEQEKRASVAPEVVKYAQAVSDHIAAKAAAEPQLVGHPDMPLTQGTSLAGALVDAATAAAESGDASKVTRPLAEITTWVKAHAAKFPHVDWGYVLQLAEEAAGAAAKLAA